AMKSFKILKAFSRFPPKVINPDNLKSWVLEKAAEFINSLSFIISYFLKPENNK
uniref:Uncharacterized protein n=1 Tax=Latimeria chalumnae TaxID=7897 RepID=H3AIC1_LATCH